MQIKVLGGEVSISRKEGKPLLELTVLENGVPGYIPPDWLTIEVTPDEARLIASALLEVQKQIEQSPMENQKCQTASAS